MAENLKGENGKFDSSETYDLNLIKEIRNKYNLELPSDVKIIYNALNTGGISFKSQIGDKFDDLITDKYMGFDEKGFYTSDKSKCGTSKRRSNNPDKRKSKTGKDTSNFKESFDSLDDETKEQVYKEIGKQDKKRKFLILVCSVVVGACLIYLGFYIYFAGRTERQTEDLASLIKEEKIDYSANKIVLPKADSNQSQNVPLKDPEILEKYKEVYNRNKSLIGWIQIADTNIDYPVMQTVDNEYYLTNNFNQEYDKNGSIFLDCNCSIYPRSTNLIVYGHHMKSGKMFGTLQDYDSSKYYQKHKYILFDTLYEEGVYEVMYVFRDKVHTNEEVDFKYYEFIDAFSEEEFNSYMNEMSMASLYDTGVNASFGDQLLTLSTCDYQQKNGRFVVVAKRVYMD